MSKKKVTLTLEDALRIFDHARHSKLDRRGASLYLADGNSYGDNVYRAAVRRKSTETLAEMLIRCAEKATENQINEVRYIGFDPVRCEICGKPYARRSTKRCYRCTNAPTTIEAAEIKRRQIQEEFEKYEGPPQ